LKFFIAFLNKLLPSVEGSVELSLLVDVEEEDGDLLSVKEVAFIDADIELIEFASLLLFVEVANDGKGDDGDSGASGALSIH